VYTKSATGETVRADGLVLARGSYKGSGRLPSAALEVLTKRVRKLKQIAFEKPKVKTTGAFGKCKCCGPATLLPNRIKDWYARSNAYVIEYGVLGDALKEEGIQLIVESGVAREAAEFYVKAIEEKYKPEIVTPE
jgi:hypothetical protein